jgi:hypothetical protein
MTALAAFALMIVWHCLAYYPLQGDYLSRAKDRANPLGAHGVWIHALGAHAIIHGAGVWVITGLWQLGVAEVVAHAVIDYAKTRGRITYHQDQALHVICKGFWALIFWWGHGL